MKKVKRIRKTKKLSSKQLQKMNIKTVKRWMTCSTSNCSNETLVEEDVIKVKCSICTLAMAPVPKRLLEQKKAKAEKPAGWRFMKLFVDKDGIVYHTGVIQPELKGTLDPSDVDKIREDQKKKREETKKKKELREKLKQERLAKQHEKAKKAKKKASDKKQKAIDKLNGKETKKKSSKKKNTNNVFRYEKFEEAMNFMNSVNIKPIKFAPGWNTYDDYTIDIAKKYGIKYIYVYSKNPLDKPKIQDGIIINFYYNFWHDYEFI